MQNLVETAHKLYSNGQYTQAIAAYAAVQIRYPQVSDLFEINIALCKDKLEKAKIVRTTPEIYVTLTTINSRLDKIKPVLESLHKQTLKPKKIVLNISEEPYLLDTGITKKDPRLSALEQLSLVEVNWTPNYGPYRKIVPFLENHFSSDKTEDKLFITVDDDTLYPDYFIHELYNEYELNNCIVGFRGRFITIEDKSITSYTKWKLGKTEKSINNLPTGKDGIIYNTKFFTKDFVEINTAIKLAPTADDLWIKWHTGLNGIKSIILNPEAATSDYKSFPVVDYSAAYRDVSLFKAHNSHGSGGKNDLSVSNLENHFMERYGYNLSTLCMPEEP